MEFSCALGMGKIDDSLSNFMNPRTKNKISCEISVVQTSLWQLAFISPWHEKFPCIPETFFSSNTSFREHAIEQVSFFQSTFWNFVAFRFHGPSGNLNSNFSGIGKNVIY